MSGEVPLHRLVRALLADFVVTPEGPRMSEEALDRWFEELRRAPERERIALDLVVVARRFHQARARDALAQAVTLAVAATHGDLVRRALQEEGADGAVERIVAEAEERSRRPTDGLSPPTRPGGVGLRRRGR